MPRLHVAFAIGWLCCCGLLFAPSDAMTETIYESVSHEARQISSASLAEPLPPDSWQATLAQRRKMWHEMLGLDPLPERTPLEAQVTGVLDRGDYVVEKIHFQSLPGAYVIGNLYRPAKVAGRLPAVLYLCGHSKGKVNPPYQANPRWFGQHGYVALVLDPIQLGESQGLHHGTYREGRWDWPSRGYTPLGTEVWNAMRALDYLETRGDVDRERMGVTGLSGGGRLLVPGSGRRAGEGRRARLPDWKHRAGGSGSSHGRPLRLCFLDQLLPLVLARPGRVDRPACLADCLRHGGRPLAALRLPRCGPSYPPPVCGHWQDRPFRVGRRPHAPRLYAQVAQSHFYLVQYASEG